MMDFKKNLTAGGLGFLRGSRSALPSDCVSIQPSIYHHHVPSCGGRLVRGSVPPQSSHTVAQINCCQHLFSASSILARACTDLWNTWLHPRNSRSSHTVSLRARRTNVVTPLTLMFCSIQKNGGFIDSSCHFWFSDKTTGTFQ